MKDIVARPIGFVKSSIKEPRFGGFAGKISEIVIAEKFEKALNGLNEYSHIVVVFWMNRVDGFKLTHRPQGNLEVPEVGIFACRCPGRPNPIAVSTVRLIGIKDNTIRVEGLDAIDGTPVIDIKPYWPQYDQITGEKIPSWVNKLKF